MCAQQRLRQAWLSARSDGALWVAKNPMYFQADTEDWSDWVDAQADLSHCRVHRSFCWFCHAAAELYEPEHSKTYKIMGTQQRLRSVYRVGSQYLSPITRKPVFGVFNQVRQKPACAATEARSRLEISDIETRSIILSKQRTTKALIRMRRGAGWSAPLLFKYGKNRFSHDMAHLLSTY